MPIQCTYALTFSLELSQSAASITACRLTARLLISGAKVCHGEHVDHVGAGLGYYAAILVHLVGDAGKIPREWGHSVIEHLTAAGH